MGEIREFISEIASDWKHNRREFVESALAVLSIILAAYLWILLGSVEGAQ
jgi:hypothetical protein